MHKLLYVLPMVAACSCTPQERQGIVNDAGKYSGAKAEADGSYKTTAVVDEVGKDVLERIGDPVSLASYVAGLLTSVGVGYVKRKKAEKAATKAETKKAK
jgi:hypothetical protein